MNTANTKPLEDGLTGRGLLVGRSGRSVRRFGFVTAPSGSDSSGADVRVEGHGAVFARSGGGKLVCSAAVNVLGFTGTQLVVCDPKGEIAAVCATECRRRGPVVIIDPFEVLRPNEGCMNPLDIFRIPALHADDTADTIAAELSVGHQSQRETYWTDAACGLVSGCIASTAADPDPARRNLNTVCDMIAGEGDTVYELAKALDENRIHGDFAKSRIAQFLEVPDSSSGATRSCVLSSARQFILPLSGARVRAALERSSFDLAVLLEGEQPMTIFLVFPPTKASSHGGLFRLMLSTLLQVLAARPVMPAGQTLLLIDETANLGKFDLLPLLYSYGRGLGVSVLTEWQSLGQIMSIFETSWRTIIENASVIQAFNLHTTAVGPLAALLGIAENELRSMNHDEQLVAVGNTSPEIIRRIDYRTDPRLASRAQANPRYGRIMHPT